MTLKQMTLLVGILAIIVCLVTWTMDLSHLVIDCIYCRCERTVIGLLGVLLLLPIYPYITRYLSFVLGFFGASVATQQMILIMKSGSLFPLELPFATAAFLLIIGLVFLIFHLDRLTSGK